MSHDTSVSRRRFITTSAAASVGLVAAPHFSFGQIGVARPMTRPFGRLNFDVTTMGLGGQASVQWTPPDLDAADIIVKACRLGINYFDTSNDYGAQRRQLRQGVPGAEPGPGPVRLRSEARRRSIWLTTKTGLRWAKNPKLAESRSNGPAGSTAVDDLKRSLQPDLRRREGTVPAGRVPRHDPRPQRSARCRRSMRSSTGPGQTRSRRPSRSARYAALVDYRDGTNLTGLNPKEEKLVRHIGFSCHDSAAP